MVADTLADAAQFFRAWLSDPLRVASIIPSGNALTEPITAEISPACAPVIELGAGTGVSTRALIERGVPEEQLVLVESRADFARLLKTRFPQTQVLSTDAACLKDIELFGGRPAGAVVSGLPLLSMPPRKIIAILDGAFRHMRLDGAFYQFTYGPRCPVPRILLDRLGLKATPRERHDMLTWQVERRKRTRRLIELGGLVVKAGIMDQTGDDRTMIYGAILDGLKAPKRGGRTGARTVGWKGEKGVRDGADIAWAHRPAGRARTSMSDGGQRGDVKILALLAIAPCHSKLRLRRFRYQRLPEATAPPQNSGRGPPLSRR